MRPVYDRPAVNYACFRPWTWVLALALVAFLLAGSPVAAEGLSPASGVASAEDAVRLGVSGLGGISYVGDCTVARSPDDIGMMCSKFVAQQGAIDAYLVGRTFSEFSDWVFVEQTPDAWHLVSTRHYDDSPSAVGIPWPAG